MRHELRNAISAAGVRYVVVDFPKYTGPAFFPGHPTWVPVRFWKRTCHASVTMRARVWVRHMLLSYISRSDSGSSVAIVVEARE